MAANDLKKALSLIRDAHGSLLGVHSSNGGQDRISAAMEALKDAALLLMAAADGRRE